ncbi:MAG: CRISPR-associated endonuclease Cas1 [Proteobacteria bacterium]|nr:CRISPR-associated endonuclease Cas1 [Pseudomonadota bacterium]
MKILYLTEQGSIVKKTSRRLVIAKDGKTISEVSMLGLDSIVIFGNIQLTTQVISSVLDSGITVSFLSSGGKFRGMLLPLQHKNVFLRISQYERYLDDQFQRELASKFVRAKIINARNVMESFKKNHPDVDLSKELYLIDKIMQKVIERPPVPVLLGLEGSATAAYFRVFRKMILADIAFTMRTRRPPKDPVNVLLSFGYSMLTNEILSQIFSIGFDPYIGYYHGIDYGRPALALDLMEEFRHCIIDKLVLKLINKRIISPDDFIEVEDKGIVFNKEGIKKFIVNYENTLREKLIQNSDENMLTFRDIIRRQIQKLAKTIMTREEYTPFVIR